jgi:FtsH-binding integral membrane protein
MSAMMPRIKFRSMPLQVLLFIVTFGIYGLYWFYVTAVEMREATGDLEGSPGLWVFLMFVPFGSLFATYFYSEVFEKWSEQQFNRWLLWVLWIVFSPAVWFIVQSELNKRSTYH